MTDTRFTTVADDPYELVEIVDVDSLEDIETLLMILFDRPIRVREEDVEGLDATSLEVIVGESSGVSTGTVHDFPINLLEIVRGTAQTVADVGPYDGSTQEVPDFVAMSDSELIAALQGALGNVRLYNLLYADE